MTLDGPQQLQWPNDTHGDLKWLAHNDPQLSPLWTKSYVWRIWYSYPNNSMLLECTSWYRSSAKEHFGTQWKQLVLMIATCIPLASTLYQTRGSAVQFWQWQGYACNPFTGSIQLFQTKSESTSWAKQVIFIRRKCAPKSQIYLTLPDKQKQLDSIAHSVAAPILVCFTNKLASGSGLVKLTPPIYAIRLR